MRKFDNSSNKVFDGTVRDSLSTIKATQVRLHLLNGTCASAALLASQIELCDVLLDEISGIHTSLARDLKNARMASQNPSHIGLSA